MNKTPEITLYHVPGHGWVEEDELKGNTHYRFDIDCYVITRVGDGKRFLLPAELLTERCIAEDEWAKP